MSEHDEHKAGCRIIKLLKLDVAMGRVNTDSGTKTPMGLFRTVKRLVQDAERGS